MKLAVSYLSSKFSKEETISKINDTKCNYFHIDLMDGKYVKNKNINFRLRKELKLCNKPLEIHLMVKNPLKYLHYFHHLNVRIIYVHYSSYLLNDIKIIQKKGYRVGLVVNPDDDLKIIAKYFKYFDNILVMSVVPGLGGQKFLPETVTKLREINKYRLDNNLVFHIQIDGGINDKTINDIRKYVDEVIVGSFICNSDNYEEQMKKLKIKSA